MMPAATLIRTLMVPTMALLLVAGCRPSAAPPERSAKPPNIVWITTEDLSPRLPAYGDSTVATPHLDRLAREGVVYTNVFASAPVCAPARSSILTGLYPSSYGAQHMRTVRRTSALADITDPDLLAIPTYEAVPPVGVRGFTEYLRARGYYSTNNSKEDYQFTTPVTAWDASNDTAHWRHRPDPDQPFFAVFNIGVTHESQVWARADEPLRVDPAEVPLPPYYPDTPVVRRDVARHYTNIAMMDEEVGGRLKELEEAGLLDETIVFFFGDHGDGLPRAKRWLYDSGLRVPFVVRWPDGRWAGTREAELVSFVDLPPTLLSLAGLPIPDYMHGRAFLGPQRASAPEFVFAVKGRMDPALDNARAVTDGRFKYIHNLHPDRPFVQFLPYRDRMALMQELHRLHAQDQLEGAERLWFRDTKPPEELYDTAVDPWEIDNLAADPAHADRLVRMRAAYETWRDATGDYGALPETTLVRRLWPPDGTQPSTASVRFDAPRTSLDEPVDLRLSTPTAGASIAYRLDDEPRWRLYTAPIRITEPVTVYAQAVRIGWRHSAVDSLAFVRP